MRETHPEDIRDVFSHGHHETSRQDLSLSEITNQGCPSPPSLPKTYPSDFPCLPILADFHFRLGLDPFRIRQVYDPFLLSGF